MPTSSSRSIGDRAPGFIHVPTQIALPNIHHKVINQMETTDAATKIFGYVEPVVLASAALLAVGVDAKQVDAEDSLFIHLLHLPDSHSQFLRTSWASGLLARALSQHVLFSTRFNVDMLTKKLFQTAHTVAYLFNLAMVDSSLISRTISAGVRKVSGKKFQYKDLEPLDISTQTPQGKAMVLSLGVGGIMAILRLLFLMNRLEAVLSFLKYIRLPEWRKNRKGSVTSPRKTVAPRLETRSSTGEDGSYVDSELKGGFFPTLFSMFRSK